MALIALLVQGMDVSAQEKITIPFSTDGGRPVIALTVGASVYNFIFDTGAGGTILDEHVLSAEGWGPGDPIRVGSPGSSKAIEGHRVTIPSLSVGNLRLENVTAISMPMKELLPQITADGIIGVSSFQGYLVTMDFDKQSILFEKGTLDATLACVIKTKPSRLIAVDVSLNGERVEGHIDSGSGYGINVPYQWIDKLKLQSGPVFFKKGKTVGGEFDMYTARLKGTITIGNVELVDPEILLVQGEFKAINFGSQFLKDHLLTIDSASRLICLKD